MIQVSSRWRRGAPATAAAAAALIRHSVAKSRSPSHRRRRPPSRPHRLHFTMYTALYCLSGGALLRRLSIIFLFGNMIV